MSWRMLLQMRRFFVTQAATKGKLLDFTQMPGPKYYPWLGSLNDFLTLGKNER